MLLRSAYSEMMFIKKYFPDMNADDIPAIVEEYDSRNRRFGK
jgi:undecaprenyl diphosphate synthase/tritrans,polycis-undecaprenyl-diphosphate synthase [geranylgeranyl-diphosphate specific]